MGFKGGFNMTNLQAHMYPYGASLLWGATANDDALDITNDPIYVLLVGVHSNVPFSQNIAHHYVHDIISYEISNQSGYGALAGYTDGVGVPLTTIAPIVDTSADPLIYSEFFASSDTEGNNAVPNPTTGINGFLCTGMSFIGMQGWVMYRKTAGTTNTGWPLLGYGDLCGGSVQQALIGGSPFNTSGQNTIGVDDADGFVTYTLGVPGGQVYIGDTAGHMEANTIASISGTASPFTLTMTNPLAHTYGAGAIVLHANNAADDKCEIALGGATGVFKLQVP
jgi:hypothetical protein